MLSKLHTFKQFVGELGSILLETFINCIISSKKPPGKIVNQY